MAEASLYERLGGVFAIAAVVDHFGDAIVQNPMVGQRSDNPGHKGEVVAGYLAGAKAGR